MVHLNIDIMIITLLLAFAYTIEGRVLLFSNVVADANSTIGPIKITREEKVVKIREIMGSRPPRCEGSCRSCGGQCIAVQVPSSSMFKLKYARGEQSSDYKPITWKCKCGSYLFNP